MLCVRLAYVFGLDVHLLLIQIYFFLVRLHLGEHLPSSLVTMNRLKFELELRSEINRYQHICYFVANLQYTNEIIFVHQT